MHLESSNVDLEDLRNNQVNSNLFVAEPLKVIRKAKLRPTFLRGLDTVALQTIDFEKIRLLKEKNEAIQIKKLNKIAKGNDRYRKLIEVFIMKFESLTSSRFAFQKKRIRSIETVGKEPQFQMYEADDRRLINIFKKFEEKTKKVEVMAHMLEAMMDTWSDWDKAHANNLIGFLERVCSGEDMGTFYMKARKLTSNSKSNILNEEVRQNNVESQRKLFAS